MKKVLLVLPSYISSDEALDLAVRRAREDKAALVALYLIAAGAADDVFDAFSDIGFIGDRPSSQVSEAMMKEYRQRGYEELGKVQIRAMEEGVAFEPLMEAGEPVEKVLSAIEGMGITTAVLVKRKERAILRYFQRSYADEVAEKAPCEVIVFTGGQGPIKEDKKDVKEVDRGRA
ncbi:MAG: universal stress protein [Thermodesulfobacteriota bacterium]|nr:MAG: universal stress protein [Thermodesulfobacteriota bacterium]